MMTLFDLLSVLTGYRFYLNLICDDISIKPLCGDYIKPEVWSIKTKRIINEYSNYYVFNVKADKGIIYIIISDSHLLIDNLRADLADILINT